jgi:hypothetical protein
MAWNTESALPFIPQPFTDFAASEVLAVVAMKGSIFGL